MDAVRRRLRRDRTGDDAMIGMMDALLTLVILSIAAFIMWRASLVPVSVAETTVDEIAFAEVGALTSSLLRVTIPETHVSTGPDDGDVTRIRGRTVAGVLSAMHWHTYGEPGWGQRSCPGEDTDRACDAHPAGAAVIEQAAALGRARWIVALSLDAGNGQDPLCVSGTTWEDARVTMSACALPTNGNVIAQEAVLPAYGESTSGLDLRVLAYRGSGQ